VSEPIEGDLWRYDYLWRWQASAGETEGRKSRPVCFVILIREREGLTRLLILALTTQPPPKDRIALRIPADEMQLAGLTPDHAIWIVLDEFNHDVLEISSYFQPNAHIGRFSHKFHQKVIAAFRDVVRARKTRIVKR
jgi:hypothetical protein